MSSDEEEPYWGYKCGCDYFCKCLETLSDEDEDKEEPRLDYRGQRERNRLLVKWANDELNKRVFYLFADVPAQEDEVEFAPGDQGS